MKLRSSNGRSGDLPRAQEIQDNALTQRYCPLNRDDKYILTDLKRQKLCGGAMKFAGDELLLLEVGESSNYVCDIFMRLPFKNLTSVSKEHSQDLVKVQDCLERLQKRLKEYENLHILPGPEPVYKDGRRGLEQPAHLYMQMQDFMRIFNCRQSSERLWSRS